MDVRDATARSVSRALLQEKTMKEHKTIKDGFAWVPLEKRTSRFGGARPPRKSETRKPVLWLARDGSDLYFVNDSQDSLEFVIADTGGFQTVDDDAMTITSKEQYEYRNVNPGDAVKVDEYDQFYDLDYVLQVYLKIKSLSLGCIEIRSPAEKGGVDEAVLLWDSGEAGNHVLINKCNEA